MSGNFGNLVLGSGANADNFVNVQANYLVVAGGGSGGFDRGGGGGA